MALICGLLFAFGLGLSGMKDPSIVRGFLDIFGQWQPSLMLVMVGAILVHSSFYFFIKKRGKPVLASEFHLPETQVIDKKLILGALIFGLGWGWAGICPGPGIVALTSGKAPFFYFMASMLLGMKVYQFLSRRL